MTDKQLEKMGIFSNRSKLKPREHYCNTTGSYLDLCRTDTPEIVLEKIFEEGKRLGIKEGEERRSKQIMKLLKNQND